MFRPLVPLLILASCAPDPTVFPKHFAFGTSIAGFQHDMGCPMVPASECTDPNSDWYVWVTDPTLVADKSTKDSGDPITYSPGHYELYPVDFALARDQLGTNYFRTSIEWSRIFPNPTDGATGQDALRAIADPVALAHYHTLFTTLRTAGLKPLVTLNHYTLPTWIHDAKACHEDLSTCTHRGWLDHDRILSEIAKYAGFCAEEFGADIDLWGTLNEPLAVVLAGYVGPFTDRTNPPGLTFALPQAQQTMLTMIEAHARMYDAIHAADLVSADGGPAASVGIIMNLAAVQPSNPNSPLDNNAVKNLSYLYNDVMLNADVLGNYDAKLDGNTVQRSDLAGRMDYVGINYYARIVLQGLDSPFLAGLSPLTTFNPLTMAVEYDYPQGVHDVTTHAAQQYGLPIYITENGFGYDDSAITQHFTESLEWVLRAVKEGADIRGYFYWTLLDDYEWNQGTSVKMGLFAVDPHDPAKTRVARPLVDTYRQVTQGGRIPANLARQFPIPQ